jgi:RNA polymerase sigma-70 factor (ECF subfamily)
MPASTILDSCAADPMQDWLQAARQGSREAMGKLLEACRAYLLLVANRELPVDLRAKGGASDIVQETFLDGHRNFSRFKGETEEELLAWLRGILLNNLSMFDRYYRQAAKRQIARETSLETSRRSGPGALALSASAPSPSWHAVAREEADALDEAIARLPDDCRRIILLIHLDNLSFAAAAAALNRSVDATRRLWGRAVDLLADEVDGTHGRR